MIAISKKSIEKKSPIIAPPLRDPGQSLEEEIQKIISDKADQYAVAIAIAIALAGMEWHRWYFQTQPHPVTISLLSAVIISFSIVKLFQYKRVLKNLRQAKDGEKAVGQFLEGLREKGYRIFHDIVGNGFNVDHVLIGPTGVYYSTAFQGASSKRNASEFPLKKPEMQRASAGVRSEKTGSLISCPKRR